MTTRRSERLIAAAGRQPVERDTLYNVVDARRRSASDRRVSRSSTLLSGPGLSSQARYTLIPSRVCLELEKSFTKWHKLSSEEAR